MSKAEAFDTVADVLAGKKTGQPVRLRGWVYRARASGNKLAFVILRDGTGNIQCTIKGGNADPASLEMALRAKLEAAVSLLEGEVIADQRAPGGFEVKARTFKLYEPHGQVSGDFPLRGEQGTDFELDMRHLWLRSTDLSAILRIKHRLYKAIHDFYDAEGFTQVDPSVITTNACEGGSTLFTFRYFGQTAYLSQSAQMYLEGCIFGMPQVYSITPSFRAEKSRTSKHLTEFHHLEAECAWWDAEDNRVHQERLVTYLAHTIAKECADDLRLLKQDPARLLKIGTFQPHEGGEDKDGKRFPRLDYEWCVKELQRQGFHVNYGDDFGVPHEKALTEGRVNPMFICDWPANIKAFYMAEKPGTDRVLCSDLMAPDGFGEIIGGSQRSEDVRRMTLRLTEQFLHEVMEELKERKSDDLTESEFWDLVAEIFNAKVGQRVSISDDAGAYKAETGIQIDRHLVRAVFRSKRGRPPNHDDVIAFLAAFQEAVLKPYQWYFDLRRYGSVPHSGFGLGIERVLRWFTGQEHIRDMLPYPRTPARAYP